MAHVFFMGIDGMPPQWMIEKWLPELPTFRSVAESGIYGRIKSTVPPTSIAAWTSMFSGCDPGQHGITGYIRRPQPPEISMEIVNSEHVAVTRLWDLLSLVGKKSIVLNVPLTYPVHPINGTLVSDFLTPGFDGPCVYPLERKEEMVRLLGHPYRFDVSEFGGYRRLEKAELVERVFALTDEHLKWAHHLLVEPWDLFVFATVGSDRLHHTLWRYLDPSHPEHERHPLFSEAIIRYYKKLDMALAVIKERLPPDTIIIIASDHGMGTMHGRINLNDWLRQEGYLVLKEDFDTEVRIGPRKLDLSRVDWGKTRAYALGAYEGLLYIYPEKKKNPGEYDHLFRKLSEKIKAIPGPNGKPLRTVVHRLDELYGNDSLEKAPDGVVYMDDLSMGVNCDVGNQGLYSWANIIGPDDGLHTSEGTFFMSGPGIPKLGSVRPISIIDMTPTILTLFGLTIPQTMRGKNIFDGLR